MGVAARAVRGISRLVGLLRSRSGELPALRGGERVLVSRADHLGDLLMTLPTVQALARTTERPVDLLVKPAYCELVEGQEGVGEVRGALLPWQVAPGRGSSWGELPTLVGQLRSARYDVALECTWDLKTLALLRFAGIPRVVGWEQAGAEGWAHHRISPRAEHQVDRCLEMAAALGAGEVAPEPTLRVPEAWSQRGAEYLAGCGGGDRKVVLHLGAAGLAKRWPPERWLALGQALAAEGLGVCCLLGPEEEDLREPARSKGLPLLPPMSLTELAGTLAGCDLFLGNDSGPAHLAAACGARGLVLFGPTHASRTAPRGGMRVLQRGLDCQPCWLPRTPFACPTARECLEELPVDEVLAAVLGILG